MPAAAAEGEPWTWEWDGGCCCAGMDGDEVWAIRGGSGVMWCWSMLAFVIYGMAGVFGATKGATFVGSAAVGVLGSPYEVYISTLTWEYN